MMKILNLRLIIYDKKYFEKYGKLSLQYCENLFQYQNFILTDKPDLQSEKDNIGIEVVRVISTEEAEYMSVMNSFWGRNLKYKDIKNNTKINSPKFNGTILKCGDSFVSYFGKGLINSNQYVEKGFQKIQEKSKKAITQHKKKEYKKFNNNGLYLFIQVGVGDDYIQDLIDLIIQKNELFFDFYIFNFTEVIYIFDIQKNLIKKFILNSQNLKQLKLEAKNTTK